MSKLCSKKYGKNDMHKLNKYIKILYSDLLKSYNYINKTTVDLSVHSLNKKLNYNSSLFPKNILDYINTTLQQVFRYKAKINNKNITLNFFDSIQHSNYDETTLSHYADMSFMIIYLLSLYASHHCSKNLHINIFLTPFTKKFPSKNETIGINNVNTGFSTTGCDKNSEITIYRHEEWFKVLIHELFHNFDLEFSTMNIDKHRESLFNKFGIKSEYNIYETYCEIWARILNTAINSFFITNDRVKFIAKFHLLFNKERIFSLKQASQIMKKYKNLANYREDSNVWCYYIFTAALMNNLLDFFTWTGDSFIKFKKSESNINLFVELLIHLSTSNDFYKDLACVDKAIKDSASLRMTIL